MKIDDYKNIFNAYRITKKGNVTILDSVSGKYLIKKENKDLFSLFSYLENRSFDNIPTLVKKIDKDNVFLYEDSFDMPLGQNIIELAKVVGLLHSKTVYFKNTSLDNYKEIKENIEVNIDSISYYYEMLYLKFLKYEYYSPDKYLFLRNYTSILNIINFLKDNINSWYDLIKDKDKIRVCVNHNNISMDHFISNKKNILVSWDKYIIDTPVLDLVNLFKCECLNIDFEVFFNKYLEYFSLTEDELLLFKLLICVIDKVQFDSSFFDNTSKIKKLYLYINEVNKMIKVNV